MRDHVTDARSPNAPCAADDAAPSPTKATLLGELVGSLRWRMAGVARAEGAAPEDALDCTQEAFHAFLQRPDRDDLLGRPEEAGHVLVALVRNLARNHRRRHHVARKHDDVEDAALADDGTAADDLVAQAEEAGRLRGCMATLDQVYRSVVTLRLLEERSGEDAARTLGVTRNHVHVLLHRAKADLRRCMVG